MSKVPSTLENDHKQLFNVEFFRIQKSLNATMMIIEPPLQKGETRRAAEDKLAVIFLVIILAFIFCHLPRVAMDVHEILTLEHSNMCKEAKMRTILPPWAFVAIYVSHFSLAVNATMNMFIYCFMSPLFRAELVDSLRNFCANICAKKSRQTTIEI